MRIVNLESHFATAEVFDKWLALDPAWQDLSLPRAAEGDARKRLLDLTDERSAHMDDAGVDQEVISLTSPGLQNLEPADAVALQTATNDLLADTVRANPDRLQGWATLATPDPAAAARELERAVQKLGLNGAMIYGRTRDRNLDHADFWPIFEAAAALRVPLYLHPQSPRPQVRDAYYTGFGDAVDYIFATAGVGWNYETEVQLLRLMLGGVFDRFPDLQIISGHWGESIPFYLDHLDLLGEVPKLPRLPSDYMRSNVMITPSGLLSQRYLRWAIEVMGIDRIMFALDYPFLPTPHDGARSFFAESGLDEADQHKVASGNWERMVAGIRR